MIPLSRKTIIHHVAVECTDQQSADRFFTGVLGIPKVKSSVLSKELSDAIFKSDKGTSFDLYDNGKTRFEVFISPAKNIQTYAHICIEVDTKKDFIIRCKQQGLYPFFVEKGGKQLLFVRDFSDNLFEVVEKH